MERPFSRAKEWLMLLSLGVREQEQVTVRVVLNLTATLAIAITTIQQKRPRLVLSYARSNPITKFEFKEFLSMDRLAVTILS